MNLSSDMKGVGNAFPLNDIGNNLIIEEMDEFNGSSIKPRFHHEGEYTLEASPTSK